MQVVSGGVGGGGLLEYHVGDVITVLDRSTSSGNENFWTGVNAGGKVGWFVPSHTVTYLGDLPSLGAISRDNRKGSNRKISRDMISAPSGNVQHTGHVGQDGCFFGDVAFISGTNGRITMSNMAESPCRPDMTMSLTGRLPSEAGFSGASGRLPSSGSENGFSSLRGECDVSDSAPLLATSSEKHSQPRMGHAIGYLRQKPDKTQSHHLPQPPSYPQIDSKSHQYQSISDEENDFGSPLDLGPSLMDEVFSELGNYDTLKLGKDDKKDDIDEHHGIGHNFVDTCNKLADKVTTLTLSRKHKGKKAAFVKPIKASDEKTLENAIKMANQLASKSMQDLDKRCGTGDDMFNASPQVSPISPNSPTKKFSFKFPTGTRNRSTSPKGGRQLQEETGSNSNVESLITPTARDAYKILIEGKDTLEKQDGVMKSSSASSVHSASSHRLSLPPSSSVFSNKSCFQTLETVSDRDVTSQLSLVQGNNLSNPIPLPPKEGKSHVTTGKRHIRKNPLILTSGAAANMARRFENDEPQKIAPGKSASLKSKSSQQYNPNNDAFEDEIAYSMDALDDIPDSKYTSPKTSLGQQVDHPVEDDKKVLECDEVRIMSKVLGGVAGDTAGCVQALDLTDWNVHRAIKLVKLKALIRKPGVMDNDMKVHLT